MDLVVLYTSRLYCIRAVETLRYMNPEALPLHARVKDDFPRAS